MKPKQKKSDKHDLYNAILSLKSVKEADLFFSDLCTISELNAMSQRLLVAKMLRDDMNYSDIAEKTGVSSATISRVARCLNYGEGGYNSVLDRIYPEKDED